MNVMCKGCKRDSRVEQPTTGYSVGALSRESGFCWVPAGEGGSLWLCPTCRDIALEHLKVVMTIIGADSYVNVPTLAEYLEPTVVAKD